MKLYRVDKRDFGIGDEVVSAQEYYYKFRELSKKVEDILETYRPINKTKRTSCVFSFENELDAKKHWAKMSNAKLYLISLGNNEILHRGDMTLLDEMQAVLEKGEDVSELAKKYWDGYLSDNPVIEILTKEIIVTEIISKSDLERLEYFKKIYYIKSY